MNSNVIVIPGEWVKLLGLDRIPEAKTLRGKIGILLHQGEPYKWVGELGQEVNVFRWPLTGWKQNRSRQVFYILMGMSVSTVATKRNCHVITGVSMGATYRLAKTNLFFSTLRIQDLDDM